jgi:hypothetical protein
MPSSQQIPPAAWRSAAAGSAFPEQCREHRAPFIRQHVAPRAASALDQAADHHLLRARMGTGFYQCSAAGAPSRTSIIGARVDGVVSLGNSAIRKKPCARIPKFVPRVKRRQARAARSKAFSNARRKAVKPDRDRAPSPPRLHPNNAAELRMVKRLQIDPAQIYTGVNPTVAKKAQRNLMQSARKKSAARREPKSRRRVTALSIPRAKRCEPSVKGA